MPHRPVHVEDTFGRAHEAGERCGACRHHIPASGLADVQPPTLAEGMGAKGAMVTVYQFKVWDPIRNEYVVQPCKSTDTRIRALDGIMFGHTGEQVDPASLDAEGLYWPPGLRPRI